MYGLVDGPAHMNSLIVNQKVGWQGGTRESICSCLCRKHKKKHFTCFTGVFLVIWKTGGLPKDNLFTISFVCVCVFT